MRTKEPCVAIFGLSEAVVQNGIVTSSFPSMGDCRKAVRAWKDGVKGLSWVRIVDKRGHVEEVKCQAN